MSITLRLENGKKLPFVIDTGSPWTLFEKEQASNLGKSSGSMDFWNFGSQQEMAIYKAPKLYLGRTRLIMTGTNVAAFDRKQLSNPGFPVIGILGMDVLGNYCIQLDFKARKIRFLDGEHADKSGWGKAFPLIALSDGCPLIGENLAGVKGSPSVIDTGFDTDGWLQKKLYQQWTNTARLPTNGEARSPDGVLGGEAYPEIDPDEEDGESAAKGDTHTGFNGIGLHVLSRNLVTLDFPERKLYLKRTSIDSLLSKERKSIATRMAESAVKVLGRLHKSGQLPGWSKEDKPATKITHFNLHYPDSITADHVEKWGDPSSIYYFTLTRPTKKSPWKLQRAWRTDRHDKLLEEYHVP